MKNKKYPLIIIEWDDVSSFDGWREVGDAVNNDHPFQAKMVGWEIHRDKKYIEVCTAFDSDGECNGRRVIPRGCIRSIIKLYEDTISEPSKPSKN